MTNAQPAAKTIRSQLSTVRQSLSQVSIVKASIKARNRRQANMLAGHLDRGDSILDVGCGTGYLANQLREIYGVEPTGVDIRDARVSPIAFSSFDGTSIPFPDKSFDHIVLSFVLHHANDPLALARECHRVARRGVIVFEELPYSRPGKLLLAFHVALFARYYSIGRPSSAAYQSALAWLDGQAVRLARVALPPDWLKYLYLRFLLVYTLDN
jgi:ubiquinone/menaquinone biosynthesis C-methylase UbiE